MAQAIEEGVQSVSAMVADPAYLDQAVEEVFTLMLGTAVTRVDGKVNIEPECETLTAVIGLAGALSGACTIQSKAGTAMHMTSRMIGTEVNTIDDAVLDGLGEISNMLAGAWKAKMPPLNAECLLSVPTVVTGTRYTVHRQKPHFYVERHYLLDDHAFIVRVYGEIQ